MFEKSDVFCYIITFMNQPKKILFFFSILGFLHSFFFAQTLPLRHYSDAEGMPDVYIKCIYQDSKGYLWLGTPNGLARFDGIESRNFSIKDGLPDDFILAIAEDRSGNTWIGTNRGGLSCLRQNQVKNYTTRDGLPGIKITAVAVDKNSITWLGTNKGIARFDAVHDRFTTYTEKDGLVSDQIIDIIAARDGSIRIGTVKGLSCFVDGNFHNYTTKNGLTGSLVNHLLEDTRARTWICTNNGITCLDEGKFSHYSTADGLVDNLVLSAAEDRYGNIWFGTVNGLSRLTGGTFTNYTTKNGLPGNVILSLSMDLEGNLWIGTTAGLSCLTSPDVINYTTKDGLPNNMILAIMEDKKGRHWFATEDGLSCCFNGKFKNYTTKEGLINNRVYTLGEAHDGKIWIGTEGGISVYTPGKFTNYTTRDGLSSNAVESIVQDRNGVTWVGTLAGLNYFSGNKFLVPRFSNTTLDVEARKIVEDREGNLWIGTPFGLYRLSPTRDKLKLFSTGQGLPHSYILSIAEDSQKNIWVGTRRGLGCLKQGRFIVYTTENGLPDDKCYFIIEDSRGYLWVGTSKGMARFDGKTFKIYTVKNGLPTKNWGTGIEDSKNYLWIGGVYGVTRFNPALERYNPVPPPVYIASIKVLEENMPLSELSRLKYNQNFIRFGFVGLSFSVPGSVVYKYQLEGIDKDWRESSQRSISYPYLPPGDYRFQVKAVNNDGIESREPAQILFKILPPFWKTVWFILLLVLVLLTMAILSVSWRIRHVKVKMANEARNRQLVMAQRMELLGMLAAGAVHDLKNLLAVILGYSKIAEKSYSPDQEQQTKSLMPIEKIKKTTETALHVVKHIMTFTRQKFGERHTVNLGEQVEYILDILNVTRPAQVKILWEPPGEAIKYPIDPTRFQQVVMNLCFNAFQAMPKGGELRIAVTQTPGKEIILEVSDTGIGIEKDALGKIFDPLYTTKEHGQGTGLGLFVVKQIVDEYQGKIEVHSEPEKGSEFLIVFPF
jgi:ligand-binding sensor domain-containing protein/signal transduction histidine kinase